jgi:Flp pilus assembly protein TadG
VEFALTLPLVMLLLLVVAHVAMLARDQLALEHIAREAARAASVDDAPPAAARAAVRRLGGTREITVRTEVTADAVTVTVSEPADTAVPIVGSWVPSRTLSARATMTRER